MRNLIFLSAFVLLSSCDSRQGKDEVDGAICEWFYFSQYEDSFVFDFARNQVLWIEEKRTLKISEINDGFINFSGIKSEMYEARSLIATRKNVRVNFTVNRLTGGLVVELKRADHLSTKVIGTCKFKATLI